jgi:hypothetical protein
MSGQSGGQGGSYGAARGGLPQYQGGSAQAGGGFGGASGVGYPGQQTNSNSGWGNMNTAGQTSYPVQPLGTQSAAMGGAAPPPYQTAPGWTPQNYVTFGDTANYQQGQGMNATGQAAPGANYLNTGLIGGTRAPKGYEAASQFSGDWLNNIKAQRAAATTRPEALMPRTWGMNQGRTDLARGGPALSQGGDPRFPPGVTHGDPFSLLGY